jgi:hypothetical protein
VVINASSVMKVEMIGSSETLITTYKFTQRHSTDDHNLNFYNRENIELAIPGSKLNVDQ